RRACAHAATRRGNSVAIDSRVRAATAVCSAISASRYSAAFTLVVMSVRTRLPHQLTERRAHRVLERSVRIGFHRRIDGLLGLLPMIAEVEQGREQVSAQLIRGR